MKYIEELIPGNVFTYNNIPYLLTCDYKSNGDKLSYSLENGSPQWLSSNTIITHTPIYTLDSENNIIPVIQSHDSIKNKSIS